MEEPVLVVVMGSVKDVRVIAKVHAKVTVAEVVANGVVILVAVLTVMVLVKAVARMVAVGEKWLIYNAFVYEKEYSNTSRVF